MTQEIATTQQLEIAPRPNAFAMTTFAEVEKIADNIAKAKAFGFKEPAQVVTAIFLAQDEGKTLAQLMREVHFHEDGKISNRADHLQARFEKEAGKIIWHVRTDEICCGSFILGTEITDEQRKRAEERMDFMLDLDAATWNDPRNIEKELKLTKVIAKLNREGEVTVLRTLADADSKGISMGKNGQKNNWQTSSRAMLQWRCVTEAVNVVASHLRNGRSSDIDLFDLKAQEDKHRQRLTTAPTVSQDDVPAILEIIAQHDAELATDIPDARRKTVQGLRMDLVCKLGDLGIKPPAEPEAPAPTVGGKPASTVETVVLPPEQPSTPKQPTTRKPRPTPQPTATEDNLDMTPTPEAQQGMETPWREFKCLRGPNPGIMFDHTLESIFLTGKMAPDSPMKLDKLMAWFTGNAYHTSSDPHDKVLWAKAQEAEAELRAKFGAGAPVTPASAQTTPEPEKPQQQPASPTRWQDYTIPGKHPEYSSKKLGEIGADGAKKLHDEYLPKIAEMINGDWSKATLDQKKLKSQVALAMAELFPGKPAEDLPKKANEGVPAHTKQLLDIITQKKWQPHVFVMQCKINGWLPEEVRTIEDITAEDFESLAAEWATVEAEIDKMHQPAQQP